MKMLKNKRARYYFLLHFELMLFSLGGVCSKLASHYSFMDKKFLFFYALIIINLGVYAIVWQQIIKRLPLTTAFANKAMTVVWGIVWGIVFFSETITWGKVAGAILIITGVVNYAYADKEDANE